MKCATRAIKNAKKIRALVPDAFPGSKEAGDYFSTYPIEVLNRFHRMSEAQFRHYPKLAEAANLMRQEKHRVPVKSHGIIFSNPLFKGTLHLAQINFQTSGGSLMVPDAVMATMVQYLQVALPAISQYCAQYGENSLAVSPDILKMTVNTPDSTYDDGDLQGWIRTLMRQFGNNVKENCIVVFSPAGMVNHDGDLSKGILGYHNEVLVPFGAFPSQFQLPRLLLFRERERKQRYLGRRQRPVCRHAQS